jgi:hypothetical protein
MLTVSPQSDGTAATLNMDANSFGFDSAQQVDSGVSGDLCCHTVEEFHHAQDLYLYINETLLTRDVLPASTDMLPLEKKTSRPRSTRPSSPEDQATSTCRSWSSPQLRSTRASGKMQGTDFCIWVGQDPVHSNVRIHAFDNHSSWELNPGEVLISGTIVPLPEAHREKRKRKYDYAHLQCRLYGLQQWCQIIQTRSWKGIIEHLRTVSCLPAGSLKTSQFTNFIEKFYMSDCPLSSSWEP